MTTLLSWDSNWKELDLALNLADDGGDDFVLLEPPPEGSSYEVHANSDGNTIYAGYNNLIDADAGADILLSLDGEGNILYGGSGPDTFVLNAPGDTVYGGLYRPTGEVLATDGYLNRFEVFLDGLNVSDSPLLIQDLQLDLDELFVDFNGTSENRDGSISFDEYTALKDQLAANGVLLNAAPVRASDELPAATASTGRIFSYSLPSDSFRDPDATPLSYSARLSDGSELPDWLSIDPLTGSLTGLSAQADSGLLSLLIEASDGISLASQSLALLVEPDSVTRPSSTSEPSTPPNTQEVSGATPIATTSLPDGEIDLSGKDIANVDFSIFTPDAIANIDWNSIGFQDINPGSLAAQTLDWGRIPYDTLGAEAALSLNPKSVVASKLNIENVRQIRSNGFLSRSPDSPFSVNKGKDYRGSDSQFDIIISGGKNRNIKAFGGNGPDLFVVPRARAGQMKVRDFEPGVDAVLFDISSKALKKLELTAAGTRSSIDFKGDPLLVVPFVVTDIRQITGGTF